MGNQKRVVGVLLGSWQKKVLDVSNSFAGEFIKVKLALPSSDMYFPLHLYWWKEPGLKLDSNDFPLGKLKLNLK